MWVIVVVKLSIKERLVLWLVKDGDIYDILYLIKP